MRSIRRLAWVGALTALATTGLGACGGDDFTAITRLDKLRVLALRAEPVNPGQGEETTLDALVYTPGGTPVTYAWTWCPVLGSSNDGYQCPFTDADVAQLATALGASEAPPALDLGSDATATYKNVFPVAALAGVCTMGFNGFVPDCDDGFPVRVKLTVKSAGETLTATAIVRLPIDDRPSNVNPLVTGLTAKVDDTVQPVDETAAVTLPRIADTELGALVTIDQSESYMGKDEDNLPAVVKERLVLSWFAEAGEIDSPQTSFIDGKTDFDAMLTDDIHISTLEKDPTSMARVIVVLRDNRGGVSWTTGLVKLGALP